MKIAMVTDSFCPTVGGSETAIRKLSETFIDKGHEVIIFGTFKEVQNPLPNKLNVVKIDSKVGSLDLKIFGLLINLNKEIKKFKPDVINAHFLLKSGFLGVVVAKLNKIPVVVTVRGKGLFYKASNLKNKILFSIFRKTSIRADKLIATSEEMAVMAKKSLGRKPIALSNGVDIENFNPEVKTNIKEEYNITNNKLIVCVRRLVPKNGIEYMVRALSIILKDRQDVSLILIAPLKAEYEKLKSIAQELGVEKNILFVGEIDHKLLPKYLAAADLIVQPSLAEARSLSCLESMASGKTVVATKTGGLAELIEHKVNGYLIPAFKDSTYQVGDLNEEGVKNLANGILDIIDDNDFLKNTGMNARKTAEENSWSNISDKALEIYNLAIQKCHPKK